MDILKYILIAIYIVVCLAVIVLTFLQTKGESGASGAIVGSSSNNFYEKNKGRTKDGALKKATVVLGIFFAIGSIGLSFLYLM